ncbi:MAG: class I SAM-dependent methyltransferase [Nocardioidaceae bacterium]
MDSRAWDERYAASELVWSAAPNQFVARECADLAPGRAVDLAAGEGRNAIWLARAGWDVTAVDFSQAGLDKGRVLAGDTAVDWVCADATRWQADRPFDLAVVAYLQLAAEPRRAAVRNAFDALAPGGTFLLVAHDSTNLAEGTGGPQDPSVLMTAQDVLADLEGRSFDVVTAERVARVVAAPVPAEADPSHRHAGEPERVAWDCLVRLVRR